MVERGEEPSLTLEPRHALMVLSERSRQHLDRNVAGKFRVACAKHLAHPTRADGARDFVRSKP